MSFTHFDTWNAFSMLSWLEAKLLGLNIEILENGLLELSPEDGADGRGFGTFGRGKKYAGWETFRWLWKAVCNTLKIFRQYTPTSAYSSLDYHLNLENRLDFHFLASLKQFLCVCYLYLWVYKLFLPIRSGEVWVNGGAGLGLTASLLFWCPSESFALISWIDDLLMLPDLIDPSSLWKVNVGMLSFSLLITDCFSIWFKNMFLILKSLSASFCSSKFISCWYFKWLWSEIPPIPIGKYAPLWFSTSKLGCTDGSCLFVSLPQNPFMMLEPWLLCSPNWLKLFPLTLPVNGLTLNPLFTGFLKTLCSMTGLWNNMGVSLGIENLVSALPLATN